MNKRRVVITGVGCVSPYGIGLEKLRHNIFNYKHSLKLDTYLNKNYVVGKVLDFNEKELIPREYRRTMPRMSEYAYIAVLEALMKANISLDTIDLSTISTIIASGYNSVSPNTSEIIFKELIETGRIKSISGSTIIQMLGNIASSNISSTFNFKGRCFSPAAACAGGIQSIIMAYESMLLNKTDIVVCGGTEEYHSLTHMTFSKLGISSTELNPKYASIPFDINRTGVVCSEGAGITILQEYNEDLPYLAEIVGTGTNSSTNMVYSNEDSITSCMKEALEDANLKPEDIAYISTHATGTIEGDIAEGLAISKLFPHNPCVNTLKGYLGHTMAASGAIELIANITSISKGIWYGANNLLNYDTKCGNLNITNNHRYVSKKSNYLLKNSFGLGGINTTIIIKINKGE